jgi:hypothetical protein
VRKYNNISELLTSGSKRLSTLTSQSRERSVVLAHVCSGLPPRLAENVASAGVEEGRLTIGVVGAACASRLRYVTETLRKRVSESMGVEIQSVRIKVVPPPPPKPESAQT